MHSFFFEPCLFPHLVGTETKKKISKPSATDGINSLVRKMQHLNKNPITSVRLLAHSKWQQRDQSEALVFNAQTSSQELCLYKNATLSN